MSSVITVCTTVCTGVRKQLLCTTVCTGVGKPAMYNCMYRCGETAMYNCMYRCRETAAVCLQQYVQVWGNSCCLCTTVCTGVVNSCCLCTTVYRCGETAAVCVQQYVQVWLTAAVCVQQYVQVWGNSCMLCFHPALGEPQGAAGGMLTDEQI